jgi:hypothetical protein
VLENKNLREGNMGILYSIKLFLKDNKKYSEMMQAEKIAFFIKIIILTVVIKNLFLIISPHTFPEELSFEKAGITSPTLLEYILSSIISLYLSFLIYIPILSFNIKNEFSFIKMFLTNIIFTILAAIPFMIKIKAVYSIFFIILPLLFLIFSLKIFRKEYLYLLKTSISLHIITIVFSPFIYLGEVSENEIIYIITNLISSLAYLIYYIKMIKSRFDISIPKIIIYSIFPLIVSFIFGLLLAKADLFSSNTIKLILYQ